MRILGKGVFGYVLACKNKMTGKLYAMKQINKKQVQVTDSIKSIMKERNFLNRINSDFITTLKYAFQDNDTLYLILDLMIAGDLKYHLNYSNVFSEETSRFYAAEILLGLEHIHNAGIIYKDLKLQNILVHKSGHLKISDFGLSISLDEVKHRYQYSHVTDGSHGTTYDVLPAYPSPEIILGQYYEYYADFFGFGVLIYRFLCGKKPFQPRNTSKVPKKRTNQLYQRIIQMEPDLRNKCFNEESRSLLKGLLCKDYKKRLGFNGIDEIKYHPWFYNIDFDKLQIGDIDPPKYLPTLAEIHGPGIFEPEIEVISVLLYELIYCIVTICIYIPYIG